MRELRQYIIRTDTTGPAAAIAVQAAAPGLPAGVVDVSQFDAATLEWVPDGAGSTAVIEAQLGYGGGPSQAVAFGTAATLSTGTRRRIGLDVAAAPFLHITVNTAGGTDETGTLHVYGYTTT